MSRISNALFEFTQSVVDDSPNGSALYNVTVHADVYEEIKGDTVRIDDLRSATPVPDRDAEGNDIVRKLNGFISVIFVAFPETKNVHHRLEASERAENMADEWFLALVKDGREIGTEICNIVDITQFNDWIRPGTVKMPVCVLRMRVNPSS